MTTLNWATVYDAAGIDAYWARTAELDANFARKAQTWWATRTEAELRGRMAGAWAACEIDAYVLARSYLAARLATVEA